MKIDTQYQTNNTMDTLRNLTGKLETDLETQQDYLADTRNLEMNDFGKLVLNTSEFHLTNHANSQLANWSGIPKKYYDTMPTALRAENVNHWLQNTKDDKAVKRLIRTQDAGTPTVRAFLSDSYKTIDNYDIMGLALPTLLARDDVKVLSC